MKNAKLFSLVLAIVVTFLIFNGVTSGFLMMTDWFNELSPKMQNILIASLPLITGLIVTLGAVFRFRKRKDDAV